MHNENETQNGKICRFLILQLFSLNLQCIINFALIP